MKEQPEQKCPENYHCYQQDSDKPHNHPCCYCGKAYSEDREVTEDIVSQPSVPLYNVGDTVWYKFTNPARMNIDGELVQKQINGKKKSVIHKKSFNLNSKVWLYYDEPNDYWFTESEVIE